MWAERAFYIGAAVLIAAIWLAFLLPSGAGAHEWYSNDCCNDRDCSPIDADLVVPMVDGWHVLSTGEVVPFGDRRVRMTPAEADTPYHRCVRADGTTRCLYVPDFGS